MQLTSGIIIALVLLWILLAIGLAWVLYYFRSLSRDVNKGNLIRIIDRVIEKEIINRKKVDKLNKDLENFKKESLSDIRKIGLVKFNPFNELGGEHSFSLAMLDGENK